MDQLLVAARSHVEIMDKGGKDEPASSLPVSANELSAEAKSLRSVETQAHEMSKSEVMDVENSEERIRASRADAAPSPAMRRASLPTRAQAICT